MEAASSEYPGHCPTAGQTRRAIHHTNGWATANSSAQRLLRREPAAVVAAREAAYARDDVEAVAGAADEDEG